MTIATTAEIIPLRTIKAASITVIFEEGLGGSQDGIPITVSHYATNGMSIWEIAPTSMPHGLGESLEIRDLMTWFSGLMDIGNIPHKTGGT